MRLCNRGQSLLPQRARMRAVLSWFSGEASIVRTHFPELKSSIM